MRPRELKQTLKHLVQVDLPGPEDFAGLDGGHPPSLFLGYYTEELILEGLERFGIPEALRRQGLPPMRVSLDTADSTHHTLRLRCAVDGREVLLAETALWLGDLTSPAPWAPLLHGRATRVLFIHWLRMQNPCAPFTPERPALPGQRHPGLGVGHEVMAVYRAMAHRLSCQGIAVCPEFAHAGLLYSKEYHFLDPAAEGRLQALVRDVGSQDLVRFSWAVHLGCVSMDGLPYRWEPEEQVLGLAGPLAEHLGSSEWRQEVARARESHRFTVDEALLERLWPLDQQGAPKEGVLTPAPAPSRYPRGGGAS